MLSNYLKNTLKYLHYKRTYPTSKISFGSHITGKSRLGNHVSVDLDCHINESEIGDYVKLSKSSYISESNIGDYARLSESSYITNSKLGRKILLFERTHLKNVSISDFTYVANNAFISDTEVGKFCSIGSNLICAPGDHPTAFISTSPAFYLATKSYPFAFSDGNEFFEYTSPTHIGSDVWIGARVFIKNGVKIGDGAIIAAGAVVVKDVPAYAIVGGVPAKIIRFRFPETVVRELLDIQWWNWDEEKLREGQKFFAQEDITPFLKWVSSSKGSLVS